VAKGVVRKPEEGIGKLVTRVPVWKQLPIPDFSIGTWCCSLKKVSKRSMGEKGSHSEKGNQNPSTKLVYEATRPLLAWETRPAPKSNLSNLQQRKIPKELAKGGREKGARRDMGGNLLNANTERPRHIISEGPLDRRKTEKKRRLMSTQRLVLNRSGGKGAWAQKLRNLVTPLAPNDEVYRFLSG